MACKKLMWGKSTLCGDGNAKAFKGVDNDVQCDCEQCGGAEDVTMIELLRANIAGESVQKMRDRAFLAAYKELLDKECGPDPLYNKYECDREEPK